MPVWILIALLISTTATDADMTAKRLDGAPVSGALESWQDGQIVLSTPTGLQSVAETDLLSLERVKSGGSNSGDDSRKPIVELVDGTVLPIAEFTVTASKAAIVPRFRDVSASADSQPVSVLVKKVKAVRLQPMPVAIEKEWEDVLASAASTDSAATSDLLVVFKHGGQSLDYLEGVVGQITEREVEFTHDKNTVRVGRDKVAGLVFYRTNSASEDTPHCVLSGWDELRIRSGKDIRLNGGELQVTTLAALNLRWPWAEITSADFSAGKLAFLSDLTPVSQSWQPLVALPVAAAHAAAMGQPRIDRGPSGGLLSLWFPDADQPTEIGHAESFTKGIAVRSRTEIVYRLPRGFSRFSAIAGIEPSTRSNGDVTLTILGDDRPLLERGVSGGDAPLPIDLDVAGVRQLKIVVDYGKNRDTGDWLNLCDARIIK